MSTVKIKRLPKTDTPTIPAPPLKLDLGCGGRKQPGFTGVDSLSFPGVDVVADLRQRWPFEDSSVDEAYSSHCLEHFDANERVHFLNELWRVLKPGAKCTVIVPHWSSCRAYGDPTHKWPPMCEFLWNYLKPDWRAGNAPHTDIKFNPQGFCCNFDVTGGYSLEAGVAARNQEYQQHAIQYFKEACQDMISTLTAVK